MPSMASCVVPVMAMWTLEHVFPLNGSLGWRESDAESIAGGLSVGVLIGRIMDRSFLLS